MTATLTPLTCRETALLRAVSEGRVDMTCSSEPDMFVDGLNCCDQPTARALFHHGWVRPAHPGTMTEHVPAELTAAGRAACGAVRVESVVAA
jgi:hypothetical protein